MKMDMTKTTVITGRSCANRHLEEFSACSGNAGLHLRCAI